MRGRLLGEPIYEVKLGPHLYNLPSKICKLYRLKNTTAKDATVTD
jgi:hypothetical protein